MCLQIATFGYINASLSKAISKSFEFGVKKETAKHSSSYICNPTSLLQWLDGTLLHPPPASSSFLLQNSFHSISANPLQYKFSISSCTVSRLKDFPGLVGGIPSSAQAAVVIRNLLLATNSSFPNTLYARGMNVAVTQPNHRDMWPRHDGDKYLPRHQKCGTCFHIFVLPV